MIPTLSRAWALTFTFGCAAAAPALTPDERRHNRMEASATPEVEMQGDPSRHNAQVVRKIYEQCINQGDVTSLSELVHESFEGAQGERGPAGFGDTIRALRSAFPNIHFTIEDLIADGDRVAVRWRWEGKHEGGFRGIPATGRRIATTGIAIYAFERGAVRRAWLESDRLGVLQKMGVVAAIPTASGAAPPP